MRLPSAAPLLRPLVAPFCAVIFASGGPLLPLPPPAVAAAPQVPTTDELSRLTVGLSRVDFLLDHWDELTTVCTGLDEQLENKQVMRTQNQNKCYKTPLKVQRYIGASSTKDPLFKADKLMIRAQALIADDKQEQYTDAVDAYITQQQMSSTMAYTSSWSGIENPNGSVQQIEDNLLEAKREVADTQKTLRAIVKLLDLPPCDVACLEKGLPKDL